MIRQHSLRRLISFYTVCSGLSFLISRDITVLSVNIVRKVCFFCCCCCFLAWRFTQKQIGPRQAKRCLGDCANITKTRLFKYTENFTTKNDNFQIKYSDIFHISARNIDCGYSLEPPRGGGSNEYPQSMFLNRNKKIMHAPVNTSFTT